jgi:hypothetical protein
MSAGTALHLSLSLVVHDSDALVSRAILAVAAVSNKQLQAAVASKACLMRDPSKASCNVSWVHMCTMYS